MRLASKSSAAQGLSSSIYKHEVCSIYGIVKNEILVQCYFKVQMNRMTTLVSYRISRLSNIYERVSNVQPDIFSDIQCLQLQNEIFETYQCI